MNKEKLRQICNAWTGETETHPTFDDIAWVIEALLDIKTNTDSCQEKPWPPAGVAIQVRAGDYWRTFVSAGAGRYKTSFEEPHISLWKEWRYLPAHWEQASDDENAWIVLADGSCTWTIDDTLAIGDEYNWSTIVYVERRNR